MAGYMFPWK